MHTYTKNGGQLTFQNKTTKNKCCEELALGVTNCGKNYILFPYDWVYPQLTSSCFLQLVLNTNYLSDLLLFHAAWTDLVS